MNVTEARVTVAGDPGGQLLGFAAVVLDDSLAVHDLRVLEGRSGPFVAMPSRKVSDRCGRCRTKNHLQAKFCNECGIALDERRGRPDPTTGRVKYHEDVIHPISVDLRKEIEQVVVAEMRRAEESLRQARAAQFRDVEAQP